MRGIMLGVALVLAGFQFLLTQVASYLMRTQAFGMLSSLVPEFVRTLAGPSMMAFMSFGGVVSLGYFHPIVLASLLGLAIAIATEPAAEIETRFADLALARPVARRQMITRTIVVLVIAESLLLAMMTAASWGGLVCCTPAEAERPTLAVIASLAAATGAVTLCWGGVALAIASAAKRRATASGIAAVAVLVAYLADYLGRAWEPARALSTLSPFHYFEPIAIVAGEPLKWTNVAILAAVGVAGAAVSYVVYARRDL
jgi:ABC-2 type transport system permease protein